MSENQDLRRFSHLDGHRIFSEVTETSLCLRLTYVQQGQPRADGGRVLYLREADPDTISADLPHFHSLKKLAAAMVRYINETGGRRLAAMKVIAQLTDFMNHAGCGLDFELIACQSEESHERILQLKDGNYLRVVEDDFSEVLTPFEMEELIRDEQPEEIDHESQA